MKKTLAAALVALALAGPVAAATVEGTISAVDPATRTITLEDGTIYLLPQGAGIEQITVGMKVKVTVDDASGAVTGIETMS